MLSSSSRQARYGPSKMLINTLNKKYLDEDAHRIPTTAATVTSGSMSSKSSSSGSNVDDSNSMEVAYDTIMLVGDGKDQDQLEEDSDVDKYKELEELFCATCGDVHTSLRNQLVECSDCHLLYHQDCHRPSIPDSEAQSGWQCSKCKSSAPLSVLSSSSTSSSPTVFMATKTSSSSSPHSSSSGHRKSGGGGGTSGSTSLKSSSTGNGSGSGAGHKSSGPNINIISADKRLANMKKKAAKMKETKRKNK